MKKSVSVIIPMYNCAKYIEECATSLFNQTLHDIEYIFIDDHSSDNTLEILENTIQKFPGRKEQVEIISHPENHGVAFSRQEGIERSTAEWIIFCDADDVIKSDAYRTMLHTALSTDSQMAVCGYYLFGDVGYSEISHATGTFTSSEILDELGGISPNFIHGSLWNKLINRSLWSNTTFNPGLNYCEDVAVLMKILLKDFKVSFIPDIYYGYRMHSDSLIHRKKKYIKTQAEIFISAMEALGSSATPRQKRAIESRNIFMIEKLILLGDLSASEIFRKYRSYSGVLNSNVRIDKAMRILMNLILKGKTKEGAVFRSLYRSLYSIRRNLLNLLKK